MKEFGIYNVKTKEEKIVFGYSLKDALTAMDWTAQNGQHGIANTSTNKKKRREAFFLRFKGL